MMLSATVLVLASAFSQLSAANDFNVISVLGSSVANGLFCSGNCSGHNLDPSVPPGGCYQSRLREYQAKYKKRSVFNNCKNGDGTSQVLARFDQMLSTKAGLVFIGLSLANEGIVLDPLEKPGGHFFSHFEAGMRELVRKVRMAGAKLVIGSNYPNYLYDSSQYDCIKRMNLLMQTWDLQTPQVNFLGTLDNGHGDWVPGFFHNAFHPNNLGSTEMYYAIVPSIFDAILAGKPAVPERADGSQFVTLQRSSSVEVIQFTPDVQEDTMHSFTISFRLRCDGCTGLVAALEGEEAPGPFPPRLECAPNWCKDHGFQEDGCNCGVCGSHEGLGCVWSCRPQLSDEIPSIQPCAWVPSGASLMTNRRLEIDGKSGQSVYSKASLAGRGPVINDGAWHTLLLTHYWANGVTNLVADGQLVSQIQERFGPTRFQLRPGTSVPVSYQDFLVYRSALNAEEYNFLLRNKTHVLQASLEIYAPLNAESPTENRAQSMSEIQIGLAPSMTQNLIYWA